MPVQMVEDEVCIDKDGEKLIISLKKTTWDDFFNQPSVFDDDFLSDREDDLAISG